MDENEFMEWLATVPYDKEDGPFCPFPLGGYCDCPVSKKCMHCVFCPKSDEYNSDVNFYYHQF